MAISEQQYEPSEWSITTDDPILTPEPSEVGGPCHESDWRKVWDETNPWPENAYMIIEKATGRALTLRNGELLLVELGSASQKVAQTVHNTWLCCEQNNYWGFQNKATGRYLGHDGGSSMRVDAASIQNWEMFVARPVRGRVPAVDAALLAHAPSNRPLQRWETLDKENARRNCVGISQGSNLDRLGNAFPRSMPLLG
ncbi:uncharacterized protein PG998_014459 [Apiospora kogelbergensis]|uniref:uncharacterized protein n=1 Tax=Apiospora kogelbergensis TaxID=1337665 RepID=UPI003131083E